MTYPAGATTPQSGLNLVIVDPATNGQYLALSEWLVYSRSANCRCRETHVLNMRLKGPESGDGSGVSSSTADSLVLIGASATSEPSDCRDSNTDMVANPQSPSGSAA